VDSARSPKTVYINNSSFNLDTISLDVNEIIDIDSNQDSIWTLVLQKSRYVVVRV
jgi:hypothetical protein